uniref:Uncharacterized protein n=1 Tax=Peronospora matthiolae TaxID=2874970 RepID=A0AAV1T4H2_9STRA
MHCQPRYVALEAIVDAHKVGRIEDEPIHSPIRKISGVRGLYNDVHRSSAAHASISYLPKADPHMYSLRHVTIAMLMSESCGIESSLVSGTCSAPLHRDQPSEDVREKVAGLPIPTSGSQNGAIPSTAPNLALSMPRTGENGRMETLEPGSTALFFTRGPYSWHDGSKTPAIVHILSRPIAIVCSHTGSIAGRAMEESRSVPSFQHLFWAIKNATLFFKSVNTPSGSRRPDKD